MRRPLKILFVADVPIRDPSSGSSRMLQGYALELTRQGHQVFVLTRGEKFFANEETWEGIRITSFGVWRLNTLTFFLSSLLNSFRHFERLTRRESFDLIHFQQELSSLGVLLSRRSRSFPRFFSYYSAWHTEYASRHGKAPRIFFLMVFWRSLNIFLRRIWKAYAMSRCHRITVLSQFSRQELPILYGPLHVPVRWIPGGVDTDRFYPTADKKKIRQQLGGSDGHWLFLTVRNLEPRMGVEVLIDAVQKVLKKRNDFKLWIGGTGPTEKKLQEKVKALGLSEVVSFVGLIPESKLPLYYQAADLFILPTQYMEGFGLVTIEALASGTPVLGTPIGGTQEILAGLHPDLLFRSTTAEAMAEKIVSWMEGGHRVVTLEACREYAVNRYTWRKVVETLQGVYEELLQGR
ncbi:MAG: glycosyltransferase family 4 protein [Candidatus Omnitrophica bacterium]|nr:glycosyltransferase family 4 protein [Candidatus Omnitrophota bacterium]